MSAGDGATSAAWRDWLWPVDAPRRYLTLLLLLFALKQILTVLIFPPFSGHDEIAHFDAIRTIAREHRLPRIPELDEWRTAVKAGETPPGDSIDADLYPYCLFALEWPCFPDDPAFRDSPPYQMTGEDGTLYPSGWQYAANHPPLFYMLAAPVYWAADQAGLGLGLQLRLLRLLAIPFGMLVVAGTFALSRALVPGSGFIAVTAATFVAFQPQLSYSASILNNDITVVATGVWLLTLLVLGLRRGFDRRLTLGVGVMLGLSLLFKGTGLVFIPAIAIAVIAGAGLRQVRDWLTRGLAIALVGFGMASPWYLFLWRAYGNLDGLDQVEALQAGWNYTEGAPSFFGLLTDGGFITRFWRESWGGFGWRRIPLESGLLWAIGLFCLLCLAGLALMIIRDARRLDHWQRWGVALLAATVIVGYLAVIQFGTRFELAQARYAFPVVPALAVLLMTGFRAIVPERGRAYAHVLFTGAALALTIFIYTAYVIPYWYMGQPR
jgi:4-amino-4-deoxy-L-arabinose transferase-like glycosyltransferase